MSIGSKYATPFVAVNGLFEDKQKITEYGRASNDKIIVTTIMRMCLRLTYEKNILVVGRRPTPCLNALRCCAYCLDPKITIDGRQ